MNQSLLAILRAVGYPALFAAIGAIMAVLSSSTYLNGFVALAVTSFGAILEHKLAAKLGYNLPVGQVAVSGTKISGPTVGGSM